jgi:hypothetical protein
MQRASASSPATQTPSIEPSAKRRKVDSTTSSPVTSVPGTPAFEATPSQLTPTTSRGGVSTFIRDENADTEWVLNLILPQSQTTARNNTKVDGIGSRYDALAQTEHDSHDSDEENIWKSTEGGRQTFGAFKKRHSTRPAMTDADADLSSASDAESNDSYESPEDLQGYVLSSKKYQASSDLPKDVDSDEEMKAIRVAMSKAPRRGKMLGMGMDKRTDKGNGKPTRGSPSEFGTPITKERWKARKKMDNWQCKCGRSNFAANRDFFSCPPPMSASIDWLSWSSQLAERFSRLKQQPAT